MGENSTENVWPGKVRIIHWGVAVAVTLNFFFLEEGEDLHRYLGYTAFVLVLIRIAHGLRAKDISGFSSFPVSISQLKFFIGNLLKGKHISYPGHNPLASLIYFGIWSLVVGLAISGWMLGLDSYHENHTLEEVHEVFANTLMFLVVAHFAGIGLDAYAHKRKSWLAMITGKKDK